jgi:segregation and condensation protein B
MGVTLCGREDIGKQGSRAEEGRCGVLSSMVNRGPLARPSRDRLPQNRALPAVYRLGWGSGVEPAVQGALARDPYVALVEAALLSTDEPLTARRLADVAGLADAAEARRMVRKLQALYEEEGSAFQVAEIAGGYQLLTRPEFHPWLVRLRRSGEELRLTPAARETLAIVAYRQPIMRADIEAIRGVQCSEVLRLLMERGLVRIAGRHDSLGRPVLYGTTRKFLQVFGLNSLKDLPPGPSEKTDREKGRPEDRKTERGSESIG